MVYWNTSVVIRWGRVVRLGKSTTLRQFQRLYTPTAFREERVLWRAVIQLNILRSIRTIIDALAQAPPPLPTHSYSYSHASPARDRNGHAGQASISSYYPNNAYASPPPQNQNGDAPVPKLDLDGDADDEDAQSDNDGWARPPMSMSPKQQHALPAYASPKPQYANPGPSNAAAGSSTNVPAYAHSPSPPPQPNPYTGFSPALEALVGRLAPLWHAEALLIAKLVPPNEEEATQLPAPGSPQPSYSGHQQRPSHTHSHSVPDYPPSIVSTQTTYTSNTANTGYTKGSNTFRGKPEIFIRPGAGWKGALAKARVSYPSTLSYSSPGMSIPENGHEKEKGSSSHSSSATDEEMAFGRTSDTSVVAHSQPTQLPGHQAHMYNTLNGRRPMSAGNVGLESADEAQEVLHACARDMAHLWSDTWVRDTLKRRKVRLEEGPGFFLNDLERVTSLKYMPSEDDVLKARLKTVGVSEYRFEMEIAAGRDSGTEWRIVDVGGSRSQVATWVPFFDDVDAIIFLAPISGFDQVLSEDRTVNRLEDSVLLWKAVCSNKLLANVDLVLFLNKCDLLEAKLNSGIRLAKYVRSYGDRDNDVDTVSKYLRSKFSAIHREYSPNPRKFYAFCTSVTDTATTAGIIASVRDMVIRQHLKQSKLL
ncbi:hypothetical protein HGRIS_000188 [Hohenbuehelia grisea]|uniref:G-alpha-domain-containing protein n=1 Tax=Hohenbuehelia grisea TaxID=104357 RepID=A0ABR3JS66_9AGAR